MGGSRREESVYLVSTRDFGAKKTFYFLSTSPSLADADKSREIRRQEADEGEVLCQVHSIVALPCTSLWMKANVASTL